MKIDTMEYDAIFGDPKKDCAECDGTGTIQRGILAGLPCLCQIIGFKEIPITIDINFQYETTKTIRSK